MITLNKLLAVLGIRCDDPRELLGVSDDSRVVKKDWLFLCRKGSQKDGRNYIQEVLEKEAIVLWDGESGNNQYFYEDMEIALPLILNTYYQDPAKDLHVIGITGTNGKTSVASILKQLLEMNGKATMMIGTGSIQYLDYEIDIDNTTPSACILAYYFNEARKLGIRWIVMEVSSHAIDQGRISFISFDYILYTNITRDHLDYHKTRINYQYTKFKLRKYLKKHGIIIVNQDYQYMHILYTLHDKKIITFGCGQAHYQITDIKLDVKGSSFSLMNHEYHTRLLGMVNVYNISEALIVMRCLHLQDTMLVHYVSNLHGVKGRIQVLPVHSFYVWIDYAHTQSSLCELLKFARQVSKGRVISISGCGGDRDHEKRELMARTAYMYSDISILTSDNPRSEAAHLILLEMVKNQPENYVIIENRKCAIKYAMKIARNSDIIVIAGKGNENYQLINGKKYAFSDLACIDEYRKMEEELHDI